MLILSRKYTIDITPTVYINGDAQTHVTSYTYLGVIVRIDNDDADIMRQMRCIIVSVNVLIITFSTVNLMMNCGYLDVVVHISIVSNSQYGKLIIS